MKNYRIVAFVVLVALLLSSTALLWARRKGRLVGNQGVPSPTPTVATSVPEESPTPSPVSSESPTPSPSVSPTPSPTEGASPQALPAPVSALLRDFYAAYKAQESEKLLSTYMTPPGGASEQEVHSLLLKGQDLQGVAGGPTLFVSSVASAVVQSYSVKSAVFSGSAWNVTVAEQVKVGEETSSRERVLEVTAGDKPLINRYLTASSTGKYSGFLN